MGMNQPEWYTQEIDMLRKSLGQLDIDVTSMLSASRQEFYDALKTFYSQVTYLISLYIAAFSIAFWVVGFILKDAPNQASIAKGSAGVLLLVTAGICVFIYRIMSAQYSLYVAAVIYSAQLHAAVGLETHRWFEWVNEFLKGAETKEEVINRWMQAKESTSTNYFRIVAMFTIVACIAGVGLLVWSFWSK